jgi:hypothetical protein
VTAEQRRLALDLISTIMQWEEIAAAEYALLTGGVMTMWQQFVTF